MKRVGDIYSAVDYLTTLGYVSRASAPWASAPAAAHVKAATTDRRIKAVATVSAVDVGAATRKGLGRQGPAAAQSPPSRPSPAAHGRAAGAAPVYVPYVPESATTPRPATCRKRPTTT